jgi:predicted negative regulator of RcsB-dependent stress response
MGIKFVRVSEFFAANQSSMIKKFLVCLLMVLTQVVCAQIDYSKQYGNAKALFQAGKYNLAMETFKPLIAYDQKNSYVEYASFYYAMAAYKQGYKAVAKDMLNQIKSLYPNWDKIAEVNFWLARIHFDNHDYFQGLKLLNTIQDKKFEKDIEAIKLSQLSSISDAETLKMMHEEYPKDEVVVRTLAIALAKNISNEEDKKQLEELIDHFKLKKTDFIPEAPKTVFKDRYAVSLLLPFMVTTLEATPGRKRNQLVLDFYEGLKLAIDTLAKEKEKIDISLRAYDTERNVEKMKKLLETEELKNTDIIVGPFFQEENKLAQDFSAANRINIIHPFSNNTEITGSNPYAFLFQPAAETLGKKAADYVAGHSRRKNCIVFYGTSKKDSVSAANFIQEATGKGITILLSEKVSNKETKKITDILATPTEFDEFKYPKEFTLKKDSVHSIFVASDDPLIYTKIVGGVETRGDSVMVIGSENWMDDNAIEYDKYQTLGVVMTSPNYMNLHKPHYKAFDRKFLRTHGRTATNVARMGYELMLFLGHQLKKNGVYFQDGLSQAGVLPGYLSEGFDYRFGHDNQLIPFVTFKKGELYLIEKR